MMLKNAMCSYSDRFYEHLSYINKNLGSKIITITGDYSMGNLHPSGIFYIKVRLYESGTFDRTDPRYSTCSKKGNPNSCLRKNDRSSIVRTSRIFILLTELTIAGAKVSASPHVSPSYA